MFYCWHRLAFGFRVSINPENITSENLSRNTVLNVMYRSVYTWRVVVTIVTHWNRKCNMSTDVAVLVSQFHIPDCCESFRTIFLIVGLTFDGFETAKWCTRRTVLVL